jgi:tetratricopeptide (TPR) repeat protein
MIAAYRFIGCLIFGFVFWGVPCVAQGKGDSVATTATDRKFQANDVFFDGVKAKMKEDNKQSKELFQRFTELKPDEAVGYYELAKIAKTEKNNIKAEVFIKKAIELDGTNKWYKEEYATILEDRGMFEKAASVIAELCESDPHDEELPLMTAEYYEKAKKYDQSVKYLNLALERNGFDAEILMRKVQIFLELNDPQNAAATIEQLLTKDTRNGKFYKALGEIYDNLNDTGKASKIYAKGLKLIPEDPTFQLGYAEHLLKTGDTAQYSKFVKKAILNKDFDAELQLRLLEAYMETLPSDSVAKTEGLPIVVQLVAQHPNDADILAYYGDFLENSNQQQQATEAYKKSLSLNASRFNVWLKLLQSYVDKKDADSLVKYSEKVIKLFPNQALGSYYNGIAHMNKKEYPAAIKSINRAIEIQPESKQELLSGMYSVLGDLYYFTKQYELSDNSYEKAIQLNANDASLLNNYSYYLSERGKNLDVAESYSRKSLQIRPGEPTFLDTYGWILYKKGDYGTALEYVLKAVKASAANADATLYNHLGNIYYKLNMPDKAVENWKTAKSLGCEDPFLDKKINEGKLYE